MEYFTAGLLFALVVLMVGDFLSTKRALKRGGVEANPILNWVTKRFGANAWIAAKAAGDFLAIALLGLAGPQPVALVAVVGLCALHAYLIYNNMRVGK